ncbi:hypothetical protein K1719_044124 [Acacia pycnantha]|nr:hypothetical protein K1719_044124 [Acacia pycnantha]
MFLFLKKISILSYEVGFGASATVYHAIYIPLNELVAVKCLDLDRINSNLDSVIKILDAFYRDRHYARFFVLETIARVPYFAFISVPHLSYVCYKPKNGMMAPEVLQPGSGYNFKYFLLQKEKDGVFDLDLVTSTIEYCCTTAAKHNMSYQSQKIKASWDMKTTEAFIQACLTQAYKGESSGTTLIRKGRKAILADFNRQSGRSYDRRQLKNNWHCLKKEWLVWDKLFGKETGIGWENEKNTVDAAGEWWERKITENLQYAKFRNKGLPFAEQLTILFTDVAASGQYIWAPSSWISPTQLNEQENVGDDFGVPTKEGIGDSENVSVEATEHMATINLNSSQASSSKVSGEKRNRDSVGRTNKKKAKALASSRIADAIISIVESCHARVDVVPGSSIGEVMVELLTIEALANDPALHAKCCQLMMLKPARGMFVALRDEEDKRLNWLQHAAKDDFQCIKEYGELEQ